MTSSLRCRTRSTSRRRIAGFSMIETLVAILIISLGILGTSSLLIKGMGNAKTASLRSVAAMQASSLAAAMYANRTFWATRSNAVAFTSNGAEVSVASGGIDTTKKTCAPCSPAELAGLEVSTWVKSLSNALPDAKSDVSCPAVLEDSAHNCTIKISWAERFIESGKNAAEDSVATAGVRSYFLHIEP